MQVLEFGRRSTHVSLWAEELNIIRAALRVALDRLDDGQVADELGTSRVHVETLLSDFGSLRSRMKRLDKPPAR